VIVSKRTNRARRRDAKRLAGLDEPGAALGFALLAFLLAALCYVPGAIREVPPCIVAGCRDTSVIRTPRVEVFCSDNRDLTISGSMADWPSPCYPPGTVLEKRLGEPSYRVNGRFSLTAGLTIISLVSLAASLGFVGRAIFGKRRKRNPRPTHHHA
jgi:hypothetical protein